MRIRAVAAALLLALTACGGGGGGDKSSPTTTSDEGRLSILQPLDRANEVATQLDNREAELERMVEDMGG